MQKNHNSQKNTTCNIKSFGFLPTGEEVFCYTLTNKNGVELSILNYGATISSLKIPSSNGKKTDVVLGFETIEDYINSFHLPSSPYLGTAVGRFAGRIKEGHFSIGNKPFQLEKNLGNHHLHGGSKGLSKVFWKLKNEDSYNNQALTFSYLIKSTDDQYPGDLSIDVTYTLTDENEVAVAFVAHTTEDTLVNLTQHSYFNLDGHEKDITNQELFVNSSQFLETTLENIPTGEFTNIRESAFDFTIPKKCPTKIDTTFVLNHENEIGASLFSQKNKLKMSVFTNQPAIHIYVGGNCFNQIKGKEKANYHTLSGICFEAQNFPDAPNHSHFPNAILKKGETYQHKTVFKFEIL